MAKSTRHGSNVHICTDQLRRREMAEIVQAHIIEPKPIADTKEACDVVGPERFGSVDIWGEDEDVIGEIRLGLSGPRIKMATVLLQEDRSNLIQSDAALSARLC